MSPEMPLPGFSLLQWQHLPAVGDHRDVKSLRYE